MKKIIIKIFKLFFNYGDKKIKYLINNLLDDKILLLDIGAAGGINKRWEIISNNLSTSLVEPNIDNAKILETRGYNVIKNCFYKESNKELILYETRDKYCSSLLQPNKYYLNKFFESERFDVINKIKVSSTTIDKEFKNLQIPNFIKIDTEGSELEILKGANSSLKNVMGVEIECVFNHLRTGQPQFSEIKNFLEEYNFQFIDFLHITRWEQNKQRSFGIPQITDCLFFKKPEVIFSAFKDELINEKMLCQYLALLAIYNRSDILFFFVKNLNSKLINKYKLKNLYNLIDKKITKLNYLERLSLFVKNCIHYQI